MSDDAIHHELHELIRFRHSPYAFKPIHLEAGIVKRLLEAARWAPSSYNEQPWAFVVAGRDDEVEFGRLVECLVPANREWAKNASLLIITCAHRTFHRNDKPNAHAWHDVGLAIGQLTAQASAEGLVVHQMAGIDAEATRANLDLPEGWDPVTGVAVGHHGGAELLPAEIAARDQRERTRKPLGEFVFRAHFGKPSPFAS